MDTASFLTNLTTNPSYQNQLVHQEDIPAKTPMYCSLDQPLDPRLQISLENSGIDSFYSHQAEAIDASRGGENVIVATPSASGKSLCYLVPVLDSLLSNKSSRALCLFPTKALSQDQAAMISALLPKSRVPRYEIFDGDTPINQRGEIRRTSRLILSNPDMLHLGILPNHDSWYNFLRGLKYVVIDEAHVYKGVFGSHVANLIRRLRRICLRAGSSPTFILCSATLANPGELAEQLVGLPFKIIDQDGAPNGGKDFVFWNPPMVDMVAGNRRSTSSEAAWILAELLERQVRTLGFVRSRRMAELLYIFVRDRLSETSPETVPRLSPYRASYLPEDRRRIERDLFEGRLLGLTTTNAMELGMDIGDLEATVLSGYPGSIASTWQQAGRSGRRGARAISILIALDNPLDQYLMRHPESFFGKPHESARISPNNAHILKPQLLCAAYEAPLTASDDNFFDTDISEHIEALVNDGLLHNRNGRWHLKPEVTYPAQDVNIRSSSNSFYTLVENESGAILETVPESYAHQQLHPGGIYLHHGDPYLITELDTDSHTAYSVPTDVPYYTEIRELTETRVLNVLRHRLAGSTTVYLGEVSVKTSVIGYKRLAYSTGEVLGEERLSLPDMSINTISFWFDIPENAICQIFEEHKDLAGGLHAMEHAAIGLLPLFALCDRNDIGGLSTPLHPDTNRPQVFIHDGHPGGVGISEHGYDIVEELWRATMDVVSTCPCSTGCPSCIHSPKCGNNNHPLDKDVATFLLQHVLGNNPEL